MTDEITALLRRQVTIRATRCCEYCLLPQTAVAHPHEPDHIIPRQHGGKTELDNLALACVRCNRYKGPNLGSIDPETGRLVPLFNPRTQIWHEHFVLEGAYIRPLTPEGRVTVSLLQLNTTSRLAERTALIELGLYPLIRNS